MMRGPVLALLLLASGGAIPGTAAATGPAATSSATAVQGQAMRAPGMRQAALRESAPNAPLSRASRWRLTLIGVVVFGAAVVALSAFRR